MRLSGEDIPILSSSRFLGAGEIFLYAYHFENKQMNCRSARRKHTYVLGCVVVILQNDIDDIRIFKDHNNIIL